MVAGNPAVLHMASIAPWAANQGSALFSSAPAQDNRTMCRNTQGARCSQMIGKGVVATHPQHTGGVDHNTRVLQPRTPRFRGRHARQIQFIA